MRENKADTLAFKTESQININGKKAQRFMSVYRTVGCEYDRNKRGCTMCDFSAYANPEAKGENILTQHETSLNILRNGNYSHFDLLTLGNFFNDREISADLRKELLTLLSPIKNLDRVLVESREGYLTVDKLQTAKSCLREDQILEYGLGYESSNPRVRNEILNKGVPEKHLDEALQKCKESGVDFVSYVLIKPPRLNEAEGIEDAVNTAIHVLEKADKYSVNARIAFEPVFVTEGTLVEELWDKGEYQPPKLWSIIEVLKRIVEQIGREKSIGKLFVGLSDENLSKERMAGNCGICDAEIISQIQAYNGHQDINQIKDLYHSCKNSWEDEIRRS
jgi:radical SAM enzyme (TIGR01210 family)